MNHQIHSKLEKLRRIKKQSWEYKDVKETVRRKAEGGRKWKRGKKGNIDRKKTKLTSNNNIAVVLAGA